jgi:hypothetical protein
MSCGSDAAVAEGFLQVESVTGVQILRQGRPAHSHHTGVHPLLEPTMTCLVRSTASTAILRRLMNDFGLSCPLM